MAALSKTYSFTPGTAIVAAQMNENFDDVVDWATGTPTLSTGGSATTISGTLAVTEAATLSSTLGVTGVTSLSDQVYLGGSTQEICYEGTLGTAYETFLRSTAATADRLIYLPDAGGTVALVDNASSIISNSVFN